MAKLSDKLSGQQLARLVRQAARLSGVDHVVRVVAVLADDEDIVLEAPLEEVREDVEWSESTCDAIRDHAEGCGRGAWRYAVRVQRCDDGRIVGSTWARVVVKASGDEDDVGLDGSVGSYVQQLQRSLEAQTKANVELMRLVMANNESQSKLLRETFERQALLERERSELMRVSLENELEAASKSKGAGDDMFGELMRFVGPAVGEKLVERVVPKLFPEFGKMLAEATAETASEVADGQASTGD
jgi:hypothetical protein